MSRQGHNPVFLRPKRVIVNHNQESRNKNFIAFAKEGRTRALNYYIRDRFVKLAEVGNDALIAACENGRANVVERLLPSREIEPFAQEGKALKTASKKGYNVLVGMLLQDSRSKETEGFDQYATDALSIASSNDNILSVNELLKDGRANSAAYDHQVAKEVVKNYVKDDQIRVENLDRLISDERVDINELIKYSFVANYNEVQPILFAQWRKQQPDDQMYDNFVNQCQKDTYGSRYSYANVAGAYCSASLPVSRIQELGEKLYPDMEDEQTDLFNAFISCGAVNKDHTEIVENFMMSLHNNYNLNNVYDYALREEIFSDQQPLFKVAGERMSSQYESLTKLFGDKKVSGALTPQGVVDCADYFKFMDTQDVSLLSFFAYYDVIGRVDVFIGCVQGELLEQISKNYAPSNELAFVSEAEHNKLSHLVNVDMPKVEVLASKLREHVPEIKPLTEDSIAKYEINFDGSVNISSRISDLGEKKPSTKEALTEQSNMDIDGEERLTKEVLTGQLNEEFVGLLKLNKKDCKRQVADFYQRAFGVSITEGINSKGLDETQIINDSFFACKKEVACLFSIKGGFDKFALGLASLGDGCTSNFATNFRNILFDALITEPKAKELYGAYLNHIAIPLINQGLDHLDSSAEGKDILNDKYFTQSYISPKGFMDKLSREFKGKPGETWQHIKSGFKESDEYCPRTTALLNVMEKDLDTLEQKAANVAAYFVVKATAPEIMKSNYLQSFNAECEGLIASADKQISDEIFGSLAGAISNAVRRKSLHTPLESGDVEVGLRFYFADAMKMCEKFAIAYEAVDPDSHTIQVNEHIRSVVSELAKTGDKSQVTEIIQNCLLNSGDKRKSPDEIDERSNRALVVFTGAAAKPMELC